MSEDNYRAGCGLPTVTLTERCRQLLAFLVVLLSLAGTQFGLLLACSVLADAGPALDHRVLLDRVPGGAAAAAMPTAGALQPPAVAGAAVLASSALGVLAAVLSRTHSRRGRRRAVAFGYAYVAVEVATATLLAVYAVAGLRRDAAAERRLERQYRSAFADAMWDYLYDARLKVYIDSVQQRFGCCGAFGYADWYLTDWLRPGLYKDKYYMNLLPRQRHAKRSAESYYSLAHYGSPLAQRALVAQLGDAELTSAKRCELFFNEVPFSCCDPEADTWCRQVFANRVTFAHSPADNLTLFDSGCAERVVPALLAAGRATVAPLWWPLALKVAALLLYRLLQTSQAGALAAGRHLSAARGWVLLLRPTRGRISGKPLLDDTSSADESDDAKTSENLSAEMGSDMSVRGSPTPSAPEDGTEVEAAEDAIPPPPSPDMSE